MSSLIRRAYSDPGFQRRSREPFGLMRELMDWDPFAEMRPALAAREPAFAVRFEVKEAKDAYLFKADVPGVEEKDLEITLTGNRLTVSGKRESEAREETETYFAAERSYGSFSRSFTLPEGASVDDADADLTAGVLTIVIPKKPANQPRKLSLSGIGTKVKGALGKEKAEA